MSNSARVPLSNPTDPVKASKLCTPPGPRSNRQIRLCGRRGQRAFCEIARSSRPLSPHLSSCLRPVIGAIRASPSNQTKHIAVKAARPSGPSVKSPSNRGGAAGPPSKPSNRRAPPAPLSNPVKFRQILAPARAPTDPPWRGVRGRRRSAEVTGVCGERSRSRSSIGDQISYQT